MKEQHELDPIACFLTACEIERREHRSSGREHKVVNGRRTLAEHGRFFYCFDSSTEIPLKEYASVQVIVSSAFYFGTITSKSHRSVTIALGVNLGPEISAARIEGEDGDLLQALIHRLRAIKAQDESRSFNLALARKVLSLGSSEGAESPVEPCTPPEDLTSDQRMAFVRSLSQSATYLWGPPGTGKTVLLGALAWHLYRENKRVLIVSHTNHAVDGVVESVCKRIAERGRSTIPEGSIIRLGSIVRSSLIEKFGDQVQLDSVINRSHDKVAHRLESLTRELAEVRSKLFEASKKLALLDSYAYLHGELQKLKMRLRKGESGIKHVVRRVFTSSSPAPSEALSRQQEIQESISLLESNLAEVTAELQGCERAQLAESSVELSSRQLEITEAIALLEKFTRDLRLSLLDRARIVATTATQAMLSARDLQDFNVVLIDEASMLPLPLCFVLSGIPKERVIIAGDFRQLPAIAFSDAHMVRQWYTRDIFDCAGVIDAVDVGSEHPAIAKLTTQFRSHEALCGLINKRFYGGELQTKGRDAQPLIFKEPLTYLNRNPIVLIDTSPLSPRGQVVSKSKSNLTHALLARKIAVSLTLGGLCDSEGAIGIVAPYRPQVNLIKDLVLECGLQSVSTGTIHQFQGSEREAIVLDLTDSPPHAVGSFLASTSIRDTGARLLNVALSRARRYLFVLANLPHLRSQLKAQHVLSGVLDDLEREAYRLRVDTLIGEPFMPVTPMKIDEASGMLAFQIFDQELFFPALVADLLEANQEVVFASPTLSLQEADILHTVLKEKIQRGLKVLVIVDGPSSLNSASQRALQKLREAGILIVKAIGAPDPFVVVDSEVVWLGSLAPIDCLNRASGFMTRVVSHKAASVVLDFGGAAKDSILPRTALASGG